MGLTVKNDSLENDTEVVRHLRKSRAGCGLNTTEHGLKKEYRPPSPAHGEKGGDTAYIQIPMSLTAVKLCSCSHETLAWHWRYEHAQMHNAQYSASGSILQNARGSTKKTRCE